MQNKTKDQGGKKYAGYASTKAILRCLFLLKQGSFPIPVTRMSLIQSGDAALNAPALPRTLFLLRFIDPFGLPTEVFSHLAQLYQENSEAFQESLKAILQDVYHDVFAQLGQDLQWVAPQAYVDVFTQYSPPTGQEKMLSLFRGLCQEAGLLPSGWKNSLLYTRQNKRKEQHANLTIICDMATKKGEVGVEVEMTLQVMFACTITLTADHLKILFTLLSPGTQCQVTGTFQAGEVLFCTAQPLPATCTNDKCSTLSFVVHTNGLALDVGQVPQCRVVTYEVHLNGNKVIVHV